MRAAIGEADRSFGNEASPRVRTLLLTDLVGSTELVERLGDLAASELFREHDRMVLGLQKQWRGRLIDRSDGLLLLFERPIDGLGFALDYARALRDIGQVRGLLLQARAGLHVGEVLTWSNSDSAVEAGAKPLEVEGLAKPVAARLMQLARPGQILLSAVAEPLAHRAARELGERGEHLLWKSYGRWRFKGMPQAQEIHEVGEVGTAPLRAPRGSGKAWRDVPLWRRPAALAAELLLLAGLGVGAWFVTKAQPAIAFAERDWVVVGDLRNLTGDKRLDDSLEQAFRISLEQSRHVNLLSDLKVRETLQRMQRPADAVVDRANGSEIAQRDGARALLLPTVAEVGGRLRVSVEVVDPRTQTTVYALSSDGKGIGSALDSIDDVAGQLRGKLGEALQSVEKNSVTLPNVATPSLDALKAYALARKVMETTRDREQALGLYRRALELDPQFALAHAGMAAVHAAFGEVAAAKKEWQQALAIPQRLSPQEKLRIELMLRQNDAPSAYFRKAQEYLALYPDDDQMLRRLGMNHWHQLNDFQGAETYSRRALKPVYPGQAGNTYNLAIALLGQDRLKEALDAFRRSQEGGFTGAGEYHARAYDVMGQYADADRVYAQSTPGRQGWHGEAGVATFVNRRQWPQATAAADEMLQAAQAADDALEILRARAAQASVAVFAGDADADKRLRELLQSIDDRAKAADAVFAPTSTELRLLGGLLAAQRGDVGLVDAVLRQVRDSAASEYPTVEELRQVVLAEQERLSGKPNSAVERLRPLAARDTALVATHAILLRAERAAGDMAAAQAQANWLATHRGRVLAESTTTDVLRFVNPVIGDEDAQAAAGQPLK
ncbi:MAG: putative peptide modification system cyclase [Pseudoxanthomonas sp.]